MAHSPAKRDEVKRRYVMDRLPIERAAELSDVSAGAATRWKRDAAQAGDDWDKQRAALLMAGDDIESIARQMLADYLLQHSALMKELRENMDIGAGIKVGLLASLADSYNKTIAASKRVLPETNELAVSMRVLLQLADFVAQKYPQHARIFSEILEPFGELLAKQN